MGDAKLRTRSLQLAERMGFTLDGVVPISQSLRETRRERDEAEWVGDYQKADRLSVRLTELLRRYEDGEMYEPLF